MCKKIKYKDKISDDDKETIKKAVEDAKKILNDDKSDKDKYEEATKELNEKIMPIGAKLYQSAQEDAKKDDAKDSKSFTHDHPSFFSAPSYRRRSGTSPPWPAPEWARPVVPSGSAPPYSSL